MDKSEQKYIAATWLYSIEYAESNLSAKEFYDNLPDNKKEYVMRMIAEICDTVPEDNFVSCVHLLKDRTLTIYPNPIDIGYGRKMILCSDCGKKMQLGALTEFLDNLDLSDKILTYMRHKYGSKEVKKEVPKKPVPKK